MQTLASQRFETFWSQLAPPNTGNKLAIVGSEQPLNFNCLRHKNLCHFISNGKDALREAKKLGFAISTIINHYYDIIILELTKSKETNLGLLAIAEERLSDGGKMIINGDNEVGVRSFLKNISSIWPAEITVIKKKGRIALFQKKSQLFRRWKKYQDFNINKDGYYTRCDMFSPKEVDKGSQKLTSAFSTKLFGEVADLGAGWGYLSKEALRLNDKITRITLFESNYSAYLASKKNIADKRAIFRWASIENIKHLKQRFNHVICNPPFHSGYPKDIGLLRSFIFYSSRLVHRQGSVWMVIVSGVYLERELKEYFESVKILYKDNHYFVCRLLKPKTERNEYDLQFTE